MLDKLRNHLGYYPLSEIVTSILSRLVCYSCWPSRSITIDLPFCIRNRRAILFASSFRAKSNLYIEPHRGSFISIGHNVSCNRNLYITSVQSVVIGDDCLFGPNVFISDHDHGNYKTNLTDNALDLPPVQRPLYSSPIVIGNKVWVGANVSILKGALIGDNCVIGSNSVVTKPLPPNSVCAGSPCRVIYTIP